ncbi:MAG: 6-phosphogluconolactonase [Acidimicrobiia bacterium]
MVHEWRLVDDVPAAFAALVLERRPRSIALSGGETARAGYERLAAADADWSDTEIWFGDERWVPVSDPDSNEGMARAAWLDHTTTGPVHSLVEAAGADRLDIDAAAVAYERALRADPPLDLVHLGLGPDGHTASLFPGSPALDVTDRWIVATGDDRHPHPRLTLTFPAIAVTRLVVVTVAGASKRSAVAGVRAGDTRLPAARLDAAEVVWLVDAEASG